MPRVADDRHLHRLSADDKADMAFWLDALSSDWDGSVAISNKDVSHADIDLASNATGSGWGCWRASPGSANFAVGWFPQEINDLDMAVRRPAYVSTHQCTSGKNFKGFDSIVEDGHLVPQVDMIAPVRLQERRASWHPGQVELAVQNSLSEPVVVEYEQVDKSTYRKELKTVALEPKEGKMLRVHDRDCIVARSAGADGKPKDTFRVDVSRGVVIDWLVGGVDGQSVQIGRCVSKSCVEIEEDASVGRRSGGARSARRRRRAERAPSGRSDDENVLCYISRSGRHSTAAPAPWSRRSASLDEAATSQSFLARRQHPAELGTGSLLVSSVRNPSALRRGLLLYKHRARVATQPQLEHPGRRS